MALSPEQQAGYEFFRTKFNNFRAFLNRLPFHTELRELTTFQGHELLSCPDEMAIPIFLPVIQWLHLPENAMVKNTILKIADAYEKHVDEAGFDKVGAGIFHVLARWIDQSEVAWVVKQVLFNLASQALGNKAHDSKPLLTIGGWLDQQVTNFDPKTNTLILNGDLVALVRYMDLFMYLVPPNVKKEQK
jgi:hypothetical protein